MRDSHRARPEAPHWRFSAEEVLYERKRRGSPDRSVSVSRQMLLAFVSTALSEPINGVSRNSETAPETGAQSDVEPAPDVKRTHREAVCATDGTQTKAEDLFLCREQTRKGVRNVQAL